MKIAPICITGKFSLFELPKVFLFESFGRRRSKSRRGLIQRRKEKEEGKV